jgi:CyaY protein
MLDEPRYQKLADAALRRIERALGDFDPDTLDCEIAGDVLTITLRGASKCIVNTQRPTRQLWLAANARAWHFSYDEATDRWLDDKGRGIELYSQIAQIVREGAGLDVTIG